MSDDYRSIQNLDEKVKLKESRIKCLIQLGYPEDYVLKILISNEASYCLACYFLLGED